MGALPRDDTRRRQQDHLTQTTCNVGSRQRGSSSSDFSRYGVASKMRVMPRCSSPVWNDQTTSIVPCLAAFFWGAMRRASQSTPGACRPWDDPGCNSAREQGSARSKFHRLLLNYSRYAQLHVRTEIIKICTRPPTVHIEPVFRYRTAKSDRLAAPLDVRGHFSDRGQRQPHSGPCGTTVDILDKTRFCGRSDRETDRPALCKAGDDKRCANILPPIEMPPSVARSCRGYRSSQSQSRKP